jgi:hypothetical protein
MKKRLWFMAFLIAVCSIVYMIILHRTVVIQSYTLANTIPRITPDYTSLVIPPNCAPLDFMILEKGRRYFVDIYGKNGKHLFKMCEKPQVIIPLKQWQALLSCNKGQSIITDVSTQDNNGRWTKYSHITNTVSYDAIDGYLVYRLIPPLYTLYGKMGIYQREIATFKEKPLWLNRMSRNNCMNCHTFNNNNPDYMVTHMRGGKGNGTFVKQGKNVFKLNTATEFNKPGGFVAWHPSGNRIAFSVNMVRQYFHAKGDNREGFDKGSKIILYTIATNTISTTPAISDPAYMCTQPAWSPDGKYLYYCKAPQFPPDSIEQYAPKILYDLMRISYNTENNTWGEPEIVLSHEKTGMSVSFPRISPDGKYVLCCMMPFGTFPVFRPGGDLYLLNLQSGGFRKLEVNSSEPESFHSWSSNSKWFVFASKRMDATCTRLYLSHIDSNGIASKPLLLPQKDPLLYSSFDRTYNLPELITKPVPISPQGIVGVLQDNKHIRNAQLSDELKERVAIEKKSGAGASQVQDTWRQGGKGSTH